MRIKRLKRRNKVVSKATVTPAEWQEFIEI